MDAEWEGQFLKAGIVLENFLQKARFDLRRKWVDEEMKVENFKEKINWYHNL